MLLRRKIYQIGLAVAVFAFGNLFPASAALAEKTNEIKVEIWSEAENKYVPLCQDEECKDSLKVFDTDNFLPGDTAERKVKITNEDVTGNGSGVEQEIAVEAINASNPFLGWPFISDRFGDILNFKVEEVGGAIKYEKTLSEFFEENGEVVIAKLGNNDSGEFIFSVYFNDTGDNKYQKRSLGFDIIFGLKGNKGGTPSGGSGGLPPGLTILNESVKITDIGAYNITITWTTSYFSTSQVIYSSESEYNNGYKFDLTKPNYGYFSAFPNPEDLTKVTAHTVTLIGLSPGTIYYYRTVSHASPPTISRERSFTTLALLDNEGSEKEIIDEKEGENRVLEKASESSNFTSKKDNQDSGKVEGVATKEDESKKLTENLEENIAEEITTAETERAEKAQNFLYLIIIILVLLIIILLYYILKLKKLKR